MNKESIVVCSLPRAGLGNQLFPLLKAYVFAHLNNLPIKVIGYHRIKIGAYLRNGKSARNYKGYFTFQKSFWRELLDKWMLRSLRDFQTVEEPVLGVRGVSSTKIIYRFHIAPHWSDYFNQLKDNRELVIKLFWDILSESIKNQVLQIASPDIGVHIRMGDFKKFNENSDFSKTGTTRTPEKYFVEVINAIRKVHGSDLHVSVFTDGFKHEFMHLFQLSNITLISGNSDIVDLIMLSKSKIIVASAGSTFSYWAGFLSDAPLIMHPDHIHRPIRHVNDVKKIYEGEFKAGDNLLIDAIKSIKSTAMKV